jgi:hypothetical protein
VNLPATSRASDGLTSPTNVNLAWQELQAQSASEPDIVRTSLASWFVHPDIYNSRAWLNVVSTNHSSPPDGYDQQVLPESPPQGPESGNGKP